VVIVGMRTQKHILSEAMHEIRVIGLGCLLAVQLQNNLRIISDSFSCSLPIAHADTGAQTSEGH